LDWRNDTLIRKFAIETFAGIFPSGQPRRRLIWRRTRIVGGKTLKPSPNLFLSFDHWEGSVRRTLVTAAIVILALAGCALTRTEAPQIKQVSVKDTKLTYQEQGRGRPIVFVHGAITDYRTWEGQREVVAPITALSL
jgi:hypothetical protein